LTILYAVSPIGLGHASRAIAIASRLTERGFDVQFATGPPAAAFLASYGYKTHDIVRAPLPYESNGKILFSALWYTRYWFGYRRSRPRMLRLIEEMREPELIIGDEEFSSVSLAVEKGLKNAMITDERELGFARNFIARKIEGRIGEWYATLQNRASCLIVPDFGTDEGNVRYVTPVVRDLTMDRRQTLLQFGLPGDARIIVTSMSGSGIGKYLVDATINAFVRARLEGVMLVIVGGRRSAPASHPTSIRHLGFVRDNQNLIAASELVVSLAGKSTIDEASSYGVPIIAIPLKNHFEQERNAGSLGFSYDDIRRLDSLIAEQIGKKKKKKTCAPKNYKGSSIAAEVLIDLARGSGKRV
jgi:UDP-N-acetylglucosamine--N-acetylmuramyl-(pentapeptide) pyrophosphoryl-undecaprenol N-acetylglucosamine transferase